jgi:iron complex transport system substrate-binding protein
MRTRVGFLVAMCGLIVGSCSGATVTTTTASDSTVDAFTFVGADGVESDTSDTSRIVALNGDLVEILFALGAGDRVVGRDLTATYPPEAVELPAVGLGRNLNAESVISLEPTLVIGDSQIAPLAAIKQIRQAGIPVVILNLEVALPGVSRKIATVAGILRLKAEGTALIAEVEAEVQLALDVAAQATSSPRVGYVYVRGPETLLMFGNGMPTHFLIEAAGGVDALGDIGVLFAQSLNAEELVAASPDVLITPTQGFEIIGGLDSFLALPGVLGTPAGMNGRVLTYDEALILGMGPRVGQALMELVLGLHPELVTP